MYKKQKKLNINSEAKIAYFINSITDEGGSERPTPNKSIPYEPVVPCIHLKMFSKPVIMINFEYQLIFSHKNDSKNPWFSVRKILIDMSNRCWARASHLVVV